MAFRQVLRHTHPSPANPGSGVLPAQHVATPQVDVVGVVEHQFDGVPGTVVAGEVDLAEGVVPDEGGNVEPMSQGGDCPPSYFNRGPPAPLGRLLRHLLARIQEVPSGRRRLDRGRPDWSLGHLAPPAPVLRSGPVPNLASQDHKSTCSGETSFDMSFNMMITYQRRVELRTLAGLTQQDVAQLLGVGVATVARWESPRGTRPTGLSLQLYEVMDLLASSDVAMTEVSRILRTAGNVPAVRWLLNKSAQVGTQGVA